MAGLLLPKRDGGRKPAPGTPLAPGHPLAQGLVHALLLHEGGGQQLTDWVDPGLTAAWSGTPSWLASPSGPALRFTSAGSSRISLTPSWARLSTTTPYSVAVHCRVDAASGTQHIVCYGDAAVPGGYSHLLRSETADWTFYHYTGSSDPVARDTGGVTAGRWVTLVGTWDGSNLRLYRDGLLVGGPTAAAAHARLGTEWDIGRFTDGTADLTGELAWVYLWQRALAPGEVAALTSAPFALWQHQGLAPYWWAWPSVQVAVPSSDTSLGGWTTHTGSTTNLYATLDESAPDDTDYIRSSANPSTDVVKLKLGTLVDPGGSSGHVVRYRYAKNAASGTVDLTVALLEGTTQRASWTHTDIGTTVTEAAQPLSGAEADSITDYSNLYLTFSATRTA